ncbi:nitrate regulatory protein [Methylophilus sp. YYY-1]|uniref:nitrate regulatory protein n=1 Tax=Methylophilus sp. YYY-1 TaxID=2682087 RepID=UPI0023B2DDB5|nr:nitrate regulatory protein [Methylophilus sp. YYY-1]MDF0378635.1 ANTAR domain-containing protein [Methylophilus sp. YYY-1]
MNTDISPAQTITLAKIRHIEELERLDSCIAFVEKIGQLIHQLQIERGASCLCIASGGQRFATERAEAVAQNQAIETGFRAALQQHLDKNSRADAKQLTLISWILLGLDQLTTLRHQITLLNISFADSIESFNRLIGSLIALIFEITDSSVNSKISTCLLTLYNLIQGKEFAGQERAVGAYLFGSGSLQLPHQQKLFELIAQQERHFDLVCQFGSKELCEAWQQWQASDWQLQHAKYRAKLTSARDQQTLNPSHADLWFDLCSRRLSEMWQIQCQLVDTMHELLAGLTRQAKQDYEQTREYLQTIQASPQANLNSTFFNLAIPIENALNFQAHDTSQTYPMASMIALLQHQSRQIADMETELSDTKKALTERKLIERAKGLLMSTRGLNEMEAYKTMRSLAMEQNRKIIDVAENILAHHTVTR